jgi:hypothetical protein
MAESEELEERQLRAAMNQSRFRVLNEATHLLHETAAFAEFVCECAQKTCEMPLSLSADEYEEVRRVPTHFIVYHGHVSPAIERVVRETTRYQVVEKIDVAAEVATRLDPRPHSP